MSSLIEAARYGDEPPFTEGRLRYRPIERVSNATNLVLRGRVQIQVRTGSVFAIVKLLKDRGFSVESACAWLARYLGLPAPEALWVWVEANRVTDGWPYPGTSRLCFGTEHIPNALPMNLDRLSDDYLAAHMKIDDVLLAKIAMFDAFIGNDDRHDGNILWSPAKGVFLIDHEKAMGGEHMNLFSTIPRPGPNELLRRLCALPQARRLALRNTVHSFCADCVNAVERIPIEQLASTAQLADGIDRYLKQSADRLSEVVSKALGLPELFNIKRPDVGTSPL
ncbi:HipA family kinase [Paraburkholderia sp. MM6662-R1]|uniref:HipA family kinase n=1 Tax=Paraburkholderia sp. MM6662-R1 TaxID=2991066 RepID=UPI003D1F0DF2